MRMPARAARRRGAVVPIVAVCLIGLFAFIALAIDIGIMAVARTQCQNASDIGALAGARTLDGKSPNNNLANAVTNAQSAAQSNVVLNSNITSAQVTAVTGGVYHYDPTAQRFQASFSAPASNENYGLIQVKVATSQQTYFGNVLGLSSVNVAAQATAVHRPRDVAIVLDFSGSMGYSSHANYNGSAGIQSLFPDSAFPKFGPWSVYNGPGMVMDYNNPGSAPSNLNTWTPPTPMQRVWAYVDGQGYLFSPNNLTMATVNGPAIVGQFVLSDDSTPAFVNSGTFPTFTNVNVTGAVNPTNVVTPAPANFDIQNVAGFVGDPFPMRNGVTVPQGTAPSPSQYAQTVADYLGLSRSTAPTTLPSGQSNPNGWNSYTDKEWEQNGYDWVVGTRGGSVQLKPTAQRFQGFTMGPGYFGKTFYMWPPDPRAPVGKIGDSNYVAGDWRERFFSPRSGSGQVMDDNSVFWSSSGGWKQQSPGSGAYYMVNYDAVLAWLARGPQTLPSSLRCGRVVYYDSMPTTIPVDYSSGVGNSSMTNDQRFWKDYIDYVLGAGRWTNSNGLFGVNSRNANTGGGSTLYYNNPSSSNLTPKITPYSSLSVANSSYWTNKPYMNYTDNPVHPRAHFWFGPMSMLAYLQEPGNWLPGNCYESQCWQLKAGINAALSDIRTNHPNDLASLIFFSGSNGYNTARVNMSNNYVLMQNALFFPYPLLSTLGNVSSTITPYGTTTPDTSNPAGLYDASDTVIPNAGTWTCPQMGFEVAFNQLGNANDTSIGTTYTGRRGASKVVIYETDGMPNTTCSPDPTGGGGLTGSGGPGNYYYANIGGATYDQLSPTLHVPCKDMARSVVKQIVALDTASPPGYSTSRNPARVHALAFGDLFESYSTSALKPGALRFLCAVQIDGQTSQTPPGTWDDDTLDYQTYYLNPEPYKLIIGSYNTRIDNIRQALERIMQGGVQVSLIQ